MFRFLGEKINRSIVNFAGLEKTVTEIGDRLSKNEEKLLYLYVVTKKYF